MKVTILPTQETKHESGFSTVVLLIDDQKIICEALAEMFKDRSDIKLHYCSEATKAVQMALEIKPTLILLDLVMPEIDGLTLLRYFRATNALKEIPLIVLSSTEDPSVKAKAFASGANDYMVKFPDPKEVAARVLYHSAAYIRLLERNRAYQELKESRDVLHHDLESAAHYVSSLLPEKLKGEIITDWRFIPSAELGGDSFGYHWIDEEKFAFYLLDVCGHGVRAALLSISVMNVLRSQSLGVDYADPSEVLTALNHNFPMEEHSNMYFSICYGVYDKGKHLLTVASGGHPPPVIVRNGKGNKLAVQKLEAPGGCVIGAITPMEFPTITTEIKTGDKVYLYSDGIYEIFKNDGTLLKLDEFLNIFAQADALNDQKLPEVDRVLNFSKQLMRGQPFTDDVALLEIDFNFV